MVYRYLSFEFNLQWQSVVPCSAEGVRVSFLTLQSVIIPEKTLSSVCEWDLFERLAGFRCATATCPLCADEQVRLAPSVIFDQPKNEPTVTMERSVVSFYQLINS